MLRRDWNDLLTRHYTTFPHYSKNPCIAGSNPKKIQVNVTLCAFASIWEQKFPPYQEPFQNNLYYLI